MNRKAEVMHRLGAPVPLPRRLTREERVLLYCAQRFYPSDTVDYPTSMVLERKPDRGNQKKILRRTLRARAHLVDLGLLRLNDRGCYEATCRPVDPPWSRWDRW